MALTRLQGDILRLLAQHRIAIGEAYVAGGSALNVLLASDRISRDIDFFHDTYDALAKTWETDRRLLLDQGYELEVIRERPTFVEAVAKTGSEQVLLQWTCDSAFRFFPLVEHEEMGLTMQAFDLATNKVLALAGRLEIRDWVDLMECHRRLQPLGFLAWAACGKDPGFSPESILEEAKRSARYRQEELSELDFQGAVPDIREMSMEWKACLKEAESIFALLPADSVGQAVLTTSGELYTEGPGALQTAIHQGVLRFHRGSVRGAWPVLG